ncbi:MAG: U32 family peptidase [Muribaculum sp.]|nr:U32 family peptidase [Muribaculum sp.]
MTGKPTPLELLAPAKNVETAIQAILCGADAIYMGASSHGARRAAANSVDDISRVVDFAHQFNAKVYVTVNTIIYDNEIHEVEKLIAELYRIGVDALIIQDMGILRMDIPPIELHASTQCDIRDVEKAKFLSQVGFTRLVLARELSLSEIEAIHNAVPSQLEAFIHGALCVSYSGDCRASFMSTGRSANRGECAQICRLPYDLVDSSGRTLMRDSHLLSLRDLNRAGAIGEMADAGVTSFKIEGRLKDVAYVKNTVAAYSRILNGVVKESDGRYVRQSIGISRPGFNPSLDKIFNRGYTPYFLTGKAPAKGIASIGTPKAIGMKVAKVKSCSSKMIVADIFTPLANGDGLGYFNQSGLFTGFRLNRVEGNKLFPASPQSIPAGTLLYRNRDKEFDDVITAARPTRTIAADMVLRLLSDSRIALEMRIEDGNSATVTLELERVDTAVTPQESPRRRILDKLGSTAYHSGKIIDLVGRYFIPASTLAQLRRDCVNVLDVGRRATYKFGYRLPENKAVPYPKGPVLSIHDNMANRLAADFYREHGVTEFTSAVEVRRPNGEIPVMTTRYCLRKELGKCLLTPAGKEWKGDLYLVSGNTRLRVEFDCKNCQMNLFHTTSNSL